MSSARCGRRKTGRDAPGELPLLLGLSGLGLVGVILRLGMREIWIRYMYLHSAMFLVWNGEKLLERSVCFGLF